MKFLSDKKNLYFTGMYLSLFAFMICSAQDWGIWTALFKILAILLFGAFLFRDNSADTKDGMRTADFEKSVMAFVVLLFNGFMLQRGKVLGEYEVLNILCCSVLVAMSIAYFAFYHDGIAIKKWFVENKIILLVIVCFILFSVEVINAWFPWDAWQYYKSLLGVMRAFNADFSGIYDLYLCGHVSLGYSLWLILFQMFQEGSVSVQIADIILAGISIYAYYQILRKILGNKYSNKVLAFATMPYAFSPFVMGIVGNSNLDIATLYYAVIFIACSLYRLECLELIFAFLFCFTKEPDIICYVAYVIVKVFCDYFVENRFHLWKLIKFGFCNIKNYVYALPAILWLVLYKLNQSQGGGWSSESSSTWNDGGFNCFGIDSEAILLKLKQIGFLNFNWLFWAAIILGIIILCFRKIKVEKETFRALIPISALGVAATAFGCIYITYILPRYIVLVIPVIYLIATAVIGNIKNKVFYVWNALISILLIMQCFSSIDPVMGAIYPSKQIGDEEHQVLYDTGKLRRFDDHIVYNRQGIQWSETIVKVLERAGYNGNMLLVFPTRNTTIQYEVLGNGGCVWNKRTGKLQCYDRTLGIPDQCVWVNSCKVADLESKLESVDGNRVLYIVPRCDEIDNDLISDNERATKKIVKQGEVYNKGYKVEYFVMDINYKFPLENGNYTVSPKQETSLKLCTDGHQQVPYLASDAEPISLSKTKTRYELIFDQYQVALDVPDRKVDSNGKVWTYKTNHTIAQKWILKEVDGYYMICWGDYALTYDLGSSSIKLSQKTGSDNQLWLFTQ